MVSIWQRLFGRPTRLPLRGRRDASARARASDLPAADGEPGEGERRAIAEQVRTRFDEFVFGLPRCESDDLTIFERTTLKRLDQLSTGFNVRSLPRLPAVLPELMRVLRNEHAGGSQWARLVSRDPLMVGEVMRVTRSAIYRSAQPISSLQHAVMLLGQDGLHRVLTQHLMKPILLSNSGTFSQAPGMRLWEHAARCAHASSFLGRSCGCDGFEAYLAGIVSHAGTGAVLRLLPQLLADAPHSFSTSFLAACSRLSARLTLQAAEYWELPATVVSALAAQRRKGAANGASPLAKALACADVLAMERLLTEHRLINEDLDLSGAWPDSFPAALLARCQLDLRRHFDGAPDEND